MEVNAIQARAMGAAIPQSGEEQAQGKASNCFYYIKTKYYWFGVQHMWGCI